MLEKCIGIIKSFREKPRGFIGLEPKGRGLFGDSQLKFQHARQHFKVLGFCRWKTKE